MGLIVEGDITNTEHGARGHDCGGAARPEREGDSSFKIIDPLQRAGAGESAHFKTTFDNADETRPSRCRSSTTAVHFLPLRRAIGRNAFRRKRTKVVAHVSNTQTHRDGMPEEYDPGARPRP